MANRSPYLSSPQSLSAEDFADQQRAKLPTFSSFAGQQKGNIGSTQFVFETKDLSGGRPLAYGKQTMGGLYGSGMQAGMGND